MTAGAGSCSAEITETEPDTPFDDYLEVEPLGLLTAAPAS